MAVAGIVGIAVNIALSILLINKFGIHGVTIATVLSSFSIYIVRQFSVRSIFGKKMVLQAIVSWILLMAQSVVAIRFQSFWGYAAQCLIFVLIVACNWMYVKKIIDTARRTVLKKG